MLVQTVWTPNSSLFHMSPRLTSLVSKDYSVNPTNLTTNATYAAEMFQLYLDKREGKLTKQLFTYSYYSRD